MSIHDLFQNSEDDAYNDAANSATEWKAIAKKLARRLVRGLKGGISPCPDERTRARCLKLISAPTSESMCVACLLKHARAQLRKKKG